MTKVDKMDLILKEIREIKIDVASLKEDVSTLKDDMSKVKKDLSQLKDEAINHGWNSKIDHQY